VTTTSFGLSLPFRTAGEALEHAATTWSHTSAVYAPAGRDRSGKPRYHHHTFHSLNAEATLLARGLLSSGLAPGDKVVLMVPPSLELFELTFALFKAGLVPVLVDPGLGTKRLRQCFREVAPIGFIGIPKAHLGRLAFGWAEESLRALFCVGSFGPLGGRSLDEVKAEGARSANAALPEPNAEGLAGVLFTSGSTGVPKGVEYLHRHFVAQVELLRRTFDIRPGEIDLPTFPLFGLFDPAFGMTAVLPDMDATKPGAVNPERIFEAAEHFGVTHLFGSPALLDTVSREAAARGFRFSTLKRVLSAGAPLTPAILERAQAMLLHAELFTPYGATEALPVTSVGSRFLLEEGIGQTRTGAGICVGMPLEFQDVRVIRIDDGPIPRWHESLEVEPMTIGEITVRGPSVTARYYGRDAATALAKIDHEDELPVRHRMGDLGYFDEDGRLWFCGRKSHRVRVGPVTHHTVPIEEVFNAIPGVRRTALVPVTKREITTPVLCVEREPSDARPFEEVASDLAQLAAKRPLTEAVTTFLEHDKFPVDVRHNAKIFREQLAEWAQRQTP
jgi:olefin beta-lactone synthetase